MLGASVVTYPPGYPASRPKATMTCSKLPVTLSHWPSGRPSLSTVDVAQDDQVNCTDAELDTLLERSIAVQYFPTAENRTAPTDVSLVSVMCFPY